PDAFADIAHDGGQLARAEQDKYDDHDKQQMPDTETHKSSLEMLRKPNTPPGGFKPLLWPKHAPEGPGRLPDRRAAAPGAAPGRAQSGNRACPQADREPPQWPAFLPSCRYSAAPRRIRRPASGATV